MILIQTVLENIFVICQNPGSQNPGSQNPDNQNLDSQNPGSQIPDNQNPDSSRKYFCSISESRKLESRQF